MLYLMDLTLTTNITSRDSLGGAPPDTNRFSILKGLRTLSFFEKIDFFKITDSSSRHV